MKKFIVLLFAALSLTPFRAQRLVEAGTGYSRTSVNTAAFRAGALASFGGERVVGGRPQPVYVLELKN